MQHKNIRNIPSRDLIPSKKKIQHIIQQKKIFTRRYEQLPRKLKKRPTEIIQLL